ncbi:restriction endonuclease subunit R [Streptococcus oralis]|nr:restriction endonuclease subunit R [Streptococcus oralis]
MISGEECPKRFDRISTETFNSLINSDAWQENRQMNLVKEFATEWGLDNQLLTKLLKSYDLKKPEEIPFREDLVKTLETTKATSELSGSKLKLNMELNKVLPNWMQEVKMKYK